MVCHPLMIKIIPICINTNFFPIIATHRRLSIIIDLSDKGFQPMINTNYGITVLFNGEITNFIELKKGTREIRTIFKSKTDTEVIIFSYIAWGKAFCKKAEWNILFCNH